MTSFDCIHLFIKFPPDVNMTSFKTQQSFYTKGFKKRFSNTGENGRKPILAYQTGFSNDLPVLEKLLHRMTLVL